MGIKQKALVDINGRTYMSPSAAHDKWKDLSRQKIVAECNKGKVIGACLDSSGKWIIPVDTQKPILDENIRLLLVSILCIKNKPNNNIESLKKEQLSFALEYLKETGYIEAWNEGNEIDLTSIVITDKGMELATSGKKTSINWVNASVTLIQVVGSIASIGQAIP